MLNSALAKRDLLNWSIFQLLIGNNDAHGKNISFFVARNGIDVAPAYDLVNVEIYGDEYDRDLAMAIGDTFALVEIHAYQLAEMCDQCGVPQRQVATSLKTLCSSLIKAIETFNHRQQLVGDELDFAERVFADIKTRCSRFRDLSAELPLIKFWKQIPAIASSLISAASPPRWPRRSRGRPTNSDWDSGP
jgi:serine/threonine-protein kinase HipA